MVARLTGGQEAAGSSPVIPTKTKTLAELVFTGFAGVFLFAQMEHMFDESI